MPSLPAIAFALLLICLTASAQKPLRICLVSPSGAPVANALVEVLGLKNCLDMGRHDVPGSWRRDEPTLAGTTDDNGRLALGLSGHHFRVPARLPIDMEIMLQVLEQDGTLSLIRLKTLEDHQNVLVPALSPKLVSLQEEGGRVLDGARLEVLAIEGHLLSEAFRSSGRLTRLADASGYVDLRISPKECQARVSHPLVGEGCEDIDCAGMMSAHIVRSGQATDRWSIQIEDDAAQSWSIFCDLYRLGWTSPLLWSFDLNAGERTIIRLESRDHLSLFVRIEDCASALGVEVDESKRTVVFTPCEWELCEGTPDVGEYRMSDLTLVAFSASAWTTQVLAAAFSTARASNSIFSLPHPGDESQILAYLNYSLNRLSWPMWLFNGDGYVEPRRVQGKLTLDGTRIPKRELHVSKSGSEVLVHEVSGRVLTAGGQPAANVPVLAIAENEEITTARMHGSPAPLAKIVKPPFEEPLHSPDNIALLTFTDDDGRFSFANWGYVYQVRCGYAVVTSGANLGVIEKDYRSTESPSFLWRIERSVEIRLPN